MIRSQMMWMTSPSFWSRSRIAIIEADTNAFSAVWYEGEAILKANEREEQLKGLARAAQENECRT